MSMRNISRSLKALSRSRRAAASGAAASSAASSAGKLGAGLAGRQRVDVLHDREEVGVLHAQEVVPQEIADAQQPGQRAEHLGAFQRGQFIGPRWPREQLTQVLVEVLQRRFGLGDCGSRWVKCLTSTVAARSSRCRSGDVILAPARVGDVERVVHPIALRGDRTWAMWMPLSARALVNS